MAVSVQNLEPTSLHDLVMVAWADAAVRNRPDMSSTGGYIVGMANPNLLLGERSPVKVLAWRSGKLPRIARSSLSAAIQALSEGEQELMACRLQWAELLGHRPDLRAPWKAAALVPGALVVDAKSVYDAAQKGDTASALFSMKEKYAALELMAVTEAISLCNSVLAPRPSLPTA